MKDPARQRSGIVLAGGGSTRFGRDKLAALVGGRPMLDHAILAVAAVAREVLVVGSAGPEVLAATADTRVSRLPDDRPGRGPLAALATALREVVHETAIVVAGDMPDLAPPVLALLADTLEQGTSEVAVLRSDGDQPPLPAALEVSAARAAAEAALEAGETSLRAMLARLEVEVVPEAVWRALDAEGATLRDVDREADLEETERRPRSRRASCGR